MDEGGKLVRKAIKGNDDAFLELMQLYKIDLYKTAIAYLKNEHEAVEAIQEVTVRAYRKINTIREPSYFKSWLIRIMINYCNDQLRRRRRVIHDEGALQEQGVNDNHTGIDLEDAMQRLDKRSRDLLTMKYFNDLKIKEIAAAIECPEGTVKTWLNKALKLLRAELEEKEGNGNVRKGRRKTEGI
ncbi:sigma-70 family RNA polymerase sigma factor [Virgibacillus kekensis]|uniref:Sigma-70 family RNA polymerase sigma factor n=1 Tax=Virgibacillus kekensis TaxID=202261 RepID=A0ABV9DFD3_9BACI